MKNALAFIVCICFFISGFSQITEAEYFIDTDLGIGTSNPLTVTSGNSINETFTIQTNGLAEGLHTLHIRTKGTNNVWSLYKRAYFYVQTPAINDTPQNIIAAEYYIDTDNAGVGSQTPLTVTAGMAINQEFNIPTTGLTKGLHVLHMRVKDANDTWSLYKRTYFYTHQSNTNTPATPISAAEYFFDTDPGVGNGDAVAVTEGFNINDDLIIPVPNNMVNGDHYLFVRVQDQDGTWSLYKRALFTVDNTLSVEGTNSDTFKIFPNPTTNNIQINLKKSGEYTLSIFDVSGKNVVKNKNLEQSNTIDLSRLISGVYILKITEIDTHKIIHVKIVKQ